MSDIPPPRYVPRRGRLRDLILFAARDILTVLLTYGDPPPPGQAVSGRVDVRVNPAQPKGPTP